MKISRKRRKRGRYDGCGDSCSGCDVVSGCDCSPLLLGPGLLGLIAVCAPSRPARSRPTAAGRAGVAAIRGYQRWLSPLLPTHCRHRPTCSGYGVTAVQRYGLVTGTRLTADRIRRCNSSVPCGTKDPVP